MKVGSERQAASRRRRLNYGVGEIGRLMIWILSAGTLQNWRFHREVYSERGTRRYVGKAAKLLGGTRIVLEI